MKKNDSTSQETPRQWWEKDPLDERAYYQAKTAFLKDIRKNADIGPEDQEGYWARHWSRLSEAKQREAVAAARAANEPPASPAFTTVAVLASPAVAQKSAEELYLSRPENQHIPPEELKLGWQRMVAREQFMKSLAEAEKNADPSQPKPKELSPEER